MRLNKYIFPGALITISFISPWILLFVFNVSENRCILSFKIEKINIIELWPIIPGLLALIFTNIKYHVTLNLVVAYIILVPPIGCIVLFPPYCMITGNCP